MKELIDTLSNNNYVIYGLSILLGVLIILFFIVLFSGKNKNAKKADAVENSDDVIVPNGNNNIDFDHNEYVKETTAEFELTPLSDVKPTPDGFMPNLNYEESPAIDSNNKSVEDVPLADFSFDELSKSISDELDKLKEEEKLSKRDDNVLGEIPTVTFVDAFKQTNDEIKPIEITKLHDIDQTQVTQSEVQMPVINNAASEPTFITDFNQVANQKVSEPVIKEDETPLFNRFSPETYDINKKD